METALSNYINANLKDIVSNKAQSRKFKGVLTKMHDLGYGLFESLEEHKDKAPIWESLLSDDPKVRAAMAKIIVENEPDQVSLADNIAQAPGKESRQLQPVGIIRLKDGKYDVNYGMRRCISLALNYARSGGKAPCTVEAKVLPAVKEPDAKLRALDENDRRLNESPIELALVYRDLKDGGMSVEDIAKRRKMSKQNIHNYIKLLDPKLEDKWDAIHSGSLSIDRALKLLRKRKGEPEEGGEEGGREEGTGTREKRARLPGTKGIEKIYNAKKKPKNMNAKEWEHWTNEHVRRFLAYMLKFKFVPFVAKTEDEGEDKSEAEAEKSAPKKPSASTAKAMDIAEKDLATKPYKFTIARAVAILEAAGKKNAKDLAENQLETSLEAWLPNQVDKWTEEGKTISQVIDNASIVKTVERIMELRKTGKLLVRITDTPTTA